MSILSSIKNKAAEAKARVLGGSKPDTPVEPPTPKANDGVAEQLNLTKTPVEPEPESQSIPDSADSESDSGGAFDKFKKSAFDKVKDIKNAALGVASPAADEKSPEQIREEAWSTMEGTLNDIQSKIGTYQNTVDVLSRLSGGGGQTNRFQEAFYGLNRLNQLPETPFHKEAQGMILFTRPDLNLSYNNVARSRQLSHLLSQDTASVMNAIKLMLDPSTQRGSPVLVKSNSSYPNDPVILSPLVDYRLPYLSLLSNTCISMSPPPDMGINFYTSPDGKFREQWIMNDDISEVNSYYDITAEFDNPKGNSVQMLFLSWIMYMGLMRAGYIGPHGHAKQLNRMDYFTRIERFKFDESGTRVVQWYHAGAAVPKSINIGEGFGMERIEPYEFKSKTITVQFGCVGAVYNDPIQLWEFNQRMIRWNYDLSDDMRLELMYKVTPDDKAVMNNYGYPLINLATLEMEWWAYKDDYKRIVSDIRTDRYFELLEDYSKSAKGQYGPRTNWPKP